MCARYAETIVRSMQGDDLTAPDRVVAGLCHYPGQSEPVSGLERGAMEVSERKLRSDVPAAVGGGDPRRRRPRRDGDVPGDRRLAGPRLVLDPDGHPARRDALRRPRLVRRPRDRDARLRGRGAGHEGGGAAGPARRTRRGHLVRVGLHGGPRRVRPGRGRSRGAGRPRGSADPAPEDAARPLRSPPGRPRPRAAHGARQGAPAAGPRGRAREHRAPEERGRRPAPRPGAGAACRRHRAERRRPVEPARRLRAERRAAARRHGARGSAHRRAGSHGRVRPGLRRHRREGERDREGAAGGGAGRRRHRGRGRERVAEAGGRPASWARRAKAATWRPSSSPGCRRTSSGPS